MATIKIKRGSGDPTAAQVTSAGELAANISTPKVWLKTIDDGTTTPIWVGAQIETSPGDWTSAVKLATQSAINTTFMPKAGGTFTGVVSFGQGATAPGEIRLLEDTDDGSNYSAFRGSARTANITYLMPTSDPTAGQVLSAGAPSSNISQLSWADASSATSVTTTSDNTNTTRYLVFSTTAGSGSTMYVDDTTTPLSYNPSTGVITAVGLTLSGDLTVNGTTTNINTTNLVVEDKNIVIGDAATPNDSTTADGGGITLKGTTVDKTITYNYNSGTNPNWTSSENWNIASGKTYQIAGSTVLSASAVLGLSVSSGTISSGTWNGTAIGVAYGGTGLSSYTTGQVLYASGATTLAGLTASSTAGAVIASTGAGSAPEYKTISLTNGSVTPGSGTLTLAVQDAAADGSTKGIAAFNASDFNASSGVITIDTVDGGTF